MANVLKGYRGNNTGSFKEVENITKTYDPGIVPTKEERTAKKEIRATKRDWSDRKRLRKGLDIDTDKTAEKMINFEDSEEVQNVAKYIKDKKQPGTIDHSVYGDDVLDSPSEINKEKYKNVFKKGDYVGTVKRKGRPGLNDIFGSNPADSPKINAALGNINVNLPKINMPHINLPMYKGSNLNKFVSRTGSKIKNIGKGDGKFSTKFSNACDKLGNCFK